MYQLALFNKINKNIAGFLKNSGKCEFACSPTIINKLRRMLQHRKMLLFRNGYRKLQFTPNWTNKTVADTHNEIE